MSMADWKVRWALVVQLIASGSAGIHCCGSYPRAVLQLRSPVGVPSIWHDTRDAVSKRFVSPSMVSSEVAVALDPQSPRAVECQPLDKRPGKRPVSPRVPEQAVGVSVLLKSAESMPMPPVAPVRLSRKPVAHPEYCGDDPVTGKKHVIPPQVKTIERTRCRAKSTAPTALQPSEQVFDILPDWQSVRF